MIISIGTAFIAKGYDNVMNYVQLLFTYFNAPLFATSWSRCSGNARRPGAASGLVAGTSGAAVTHNLYSARRIAFDSALAADFPGAIVAFAPTGS